MSTKSGRTRATRLREADRPFLQWCAAYRLKPSEGLRVMVLAGLETQGHYQREAKALAAAKARPVVADFLAGRTDAEVELRAVLADLVGEIEASSYRAPHGFPLKEARAYQRALALQATISSGSSNPSGHTSRRQLQPPATPLSVEPSFSSTSTMAPAATGQVPPAHGLQAAEGFDRAS